MGRIVRKKTNSKVKAVKVKTATKRMAPKAVAKAKETVSSPAGKRAGRNNDSKRRTARHIERTVNEFRTVVNISSDQLKRWLNTPESRKLHFADKPTGKAANGASGQVVLSLLKKRRDKYTDADLDQMENVVQVVKQRLEKRPKGDIIASNWRYSLMNWGHDPTKRAKRITK
jgi:hypothetical protein